MAVFGAGALVLAACDSLLGLGKYEEVQCSGACDSGLESGTAPAPDAAGDVEAGTAIEGGADADAGSDADAGVITTPDAGWPVPTATEIWAHWPMPNPDAAADPESSTPLPHPMAYDAGAEGGAAVAYDEVTKLTWWRQAQPAASYTDAWDKCYPLGTGWRVPTRIELVSLVDFTRIPTIETATFLDAGGVPTWTSSAIAGDGGPLAYWVVDFSTGLTGYGGGASQVICVNGGTP